MIIDYTIVWPESLSQVPGAAVPTLFPGAPVSYTVNQVGTNGSLTLLASGLTDPRLAVMIDPTQAYLWWVQTTDGTTIGPPYNVQYDPPITLADLRDKLRNELHDVIVPPEPPRWSDPELNQWIVEAMNDYGKHFPKPELLSWPTPDGIRTYALPGNFQQIYRVDYVDAHGIVAYLKYKPWKGGDSNITTSGYWFPYWKLGIYTMTPGRRRVIVGHYDLRDGYIELDFSPKGSPNESLTIHYGASYPVPYFDLAPITVPTQDHELILLYAGGKANLRVELQDANLSRWSETRRRRDDNPLEIMSTRYFNAYKQKTEEKKLRTRFLRRVRV